jgi:hypothetical protein
MGDKMRVPDPDTGNGNRVEGQETDEKGNPMERDGQRLTGYDRDGNPVYGDQTVNGDDNGEGGDDR